jgi:IclR family acetate operon transcriptional repressor
VVDSAIICVRSMPTMDPNRMTVTVPLGQPMAPNVAGSSKAILAFSTPAERERLLASGGGMARFTDNSIVDDEIFATELELIRDRGFAISDEESEVGAATIAVPVVLPEGEVRSSLAAIGPRDRIVALGENGMIEDMIRTAEVIAGLEQDTIAHALVPGL